MIFTFEISGTFEAEDADDALGWLGRFVDLIEGTGALTSAPQATANRAWCESGLAAGEWARLTPEGDIERGGGGSGREA
jgi:hypothetical protein